MKLKQAIDRIPGGLMLVPMLLGACVHTFAPNAGKYFGSFTNGLIAGTVPILAVWFFCMGATINLRATGVVLRKSGTLVVTKFVVAWIATVIAAHFIPGDGIKTGLFAGLSVLAITASMDMTNGGLYAAVMQQYGSKEEAGAFVLMSIESGPLVSMMILGAAGVAVFEPRLFAGAVLPFLIGFALGNLDADLRELFGRCVVPLIPFFGFALGNGIDLHVIAKSDLPGTVLGLAVIVVTGVPLIFADKFLGGGNGAAGLAASSTAGAAVANPAIIGEMIPQFKPMVPAATAIVATACLVTAILVPILTAMWARRAMRAGGGDQRVSMSLPEAQ
ncbi:2-keto-3-deoxygluconate transporter [Trinickia dinghuensis]|uniref:2-keto-3-deoxygluconate permease n=1 Tax=Trinickia dinghuensis TaxID=2291023 RepID=A0A3D8K2H4_9BURK|nr:2-keto-3-deoxygluconate transporter [Trinickia dinghuensis]RDU99518.1 2-keto-3-deoxygluconate transporter [Trinickia dinghuensis]